MRIAIMQGRLLPPVNDRIQAFPVDRWREEFTRAAEAGLAGIEWIYEVAGEGQNPLATDAGIAEMRLLATRHGIAVDSLCADWFIDRPLLRTTDLERVEREQKLAWLTRRAAAAGIRHVVLPFVDASAIRDEREQTQVIEVLRAALVVAEETGVELHLETALGPREFAAMLGRLRHPLLRVNYDSGNSASLGYDPSEEFAAYGERLGSVHIKDRLRGGGTVPLRTGNANFAGVRAGLKARNYAGLFTLQVARGESGDELAWARKNRTFAEELLA